MASMASTTEGLLSWVNRSAAFSPTLRDGSSSRGNIKEFGAAWEVTSKGDQNTNSDVKFYVGFVVSGPGVTDVALLVSEVIDECFTSRAFLSELLKYQYKPQSTKSLIILVHTKAKSLS